MFCAYFIDVEQAKPARAATRLKDCNTPRDVVTSGTFLSRDFGTL